MDSTTRFSDRVENYVRYRPTYPKEIIKCLEREIGFTAARIVADIGSGTGISTELFLQNGNTVYAVEPNKRMREKGEELLRRYPSFVGINGTAEQTTVDSGSIDVIVAGQAFHWFDRAKTKMEFWRIASPDAWIVLMWNDRQVESEFEKAYENLVVHYATDYTSANHRNISDEEIGSFFNPNPFTVQVFPNEQIFDFAGLKGRLLSSSYIPNEQHSNHEEMIAELQHLYKTHEAHDRVRFGYMTKFYVGKAR